MKTHASSRKSARRAMVAAAVAVSTVGLVSCADNSSDDGGSDAAAVKVNMGIMPWIGYGGWYVAEEKGMYEDAGFDVKTTNFNTIPDYIAALGSGSIDVANLTLYGAFMMIDQDLPYTIVLLEDSSMEADGILATDDIQSIADLKGKKVAFEEFNTAQVELNYLLPQYGMTMDDIDWVKLSASDSAVALASGRVDAAGTYEPYMSNVNDKDGIHTLWTAAEAPGLVADALMVSNKYLEENPEAIRDLLKVWDQGVDYIDENPDDAHEIIAKAVGSDAESLSTVFDGVEYLNLAENTEMWDGEFGTTTVNDMVQAMLNGGMISKEPDLDTAVDTSYLP